MKKPKNTQKSRVVESMKAAAELVGCTLETVRLAKEMGCEAFQPGNRIDIDGLQSFMAKNSKRFAEKGPQVPLRDQKLIEEIRWRRINNDLREKVVVLRSTMAEALGKVGGEIRLHSYNRMNECPPEAREFEMKKHDELCELCQRLTAILP